MDRPLPWSRQPARMHAADLDLWRRFRFGIGSLVVVLVGGTIGYWLLGLSVFDALYQTAITVTTVGYGEVGIDENTGGYRAFTLVLVLAGASTVVFTASVLLETLVEGSLNDGLRRRRMAKHIAHLDQHVIVVGWGRVGRAIARYARRHHAEVVVVDQQDIETGELDLVVGDAMDDDVLVAAGIDRAAVLIAALDTDSANLALTLTARSLRPDLFVVARTAKQSNERKFFQAGADRVVNPHEIGGSRMGALALHPTVAEFLDEVLHDEGHDVEIIELTLGADSPVVNTPVGSLTDADDRAMVVAIRTADGTYVANPPRGTLLGAGDVLVALGSNEQIRHLRAATQRPKPLLFRGASAD